MHLNQLALVPDSYAAIDTATGERFEFVEAAERLRWRWNRLAPSEPRMPRHCYVVLVGLTAEETRAARVLEFVIEKHPAAYDAYFRLYQWASRYLEPGDGFRYWRSRIGERPFVNRALPEDSEPVRRVDEGAKPIPRDQWHAKYAHYRQGDGYGEWTWEAGGWVWKDGESQDPRLSPTSSSSMRRARRAASP